MWPGPFRNTYFKQNILKQDNSYKIRLVYLLRFYSTGVSNMKIDIFQIYTTLPSASVIGRESDALPLGSDFADAFGSCPSEDSV